MNVTQFDAPIVLVHGILGFDQITFKGLNLADYFRLIPDALRDSGHLVPQPPKLNTAGSVADRAFDLKTYLENNAEVKDKKVHLIAHSMGGLDARFMISKLGMANRVLSLTTIGTPHRGSTIADIVAAKTDPVLTQFVAHLGGDINGVPDLTIEACKRFNEDTFDAPNVRYFSMAGQFKPNRIFGLIREPLGILELPQRILTKAEGDNDGLVSVKSAKFGQDPNRWTFLGTLNANHFRLINWGRDIALNPLELIDDTIVEQYKSLVIRIKQSV